MGMSDIVFTDEMLKLVRCGKKTQMRKRIIEVAYPESNIRIVNGQLMAYPTRRGMDHTLPIPVTQACYIRIGDIKPVREGWRHPSAAEISNGVDPHKCYYRIDGERSITRGIKWHSPYTMHDYDVRTYVVVTNVQCRRLQSITDEEVIKEGITDVPQGISLRHYYAEYVWNPTIHAESWFTECWQVNPWVWVIDFELLDTNNLDNLIGEVNADQTNNMED